MCNRTLLLAALLMLGSCDGPSAKSSKPSKSAEAVRIEKEVAKRVEVVKIEVKARESRLHTIRVVGFIVLASGAVTALVWVSQTRLPPLPGSTDLARPRPIRPIQWNDHMPPRPGRVIDLGSDTRPGAVSPPVRRSNRHPKSRHRHRHETPRHP